jgi:hypothetical protein
VPVPVAWPAGAPRQAEAPSLASLSHRDREPPESRAEPVPGPASATAAAPWQAVYFKLTVTVTRDSALLLAS